MPRGFCGLAGATGETRTCHTLSHLSSPRFPVGPGFPKHRAGDPVSRALSLGRIRFPAFILSRPPEPFFLLSDGARLSANHILPFALGRSPGATCNPHPCFFTWTWPYVFFGVWLLSVSEALPAAPCSPIHLAPAPRLPSGHFSFILGPRCTFYICPPHKIYKVVLDSRLVIVVILGRVRNSFHFERKDQHLEVKRPRLTSSRYQVASAGPKGHLWSVDRRAAWSLAGNGAWAGGPGSQGSRRIPRPLPPACLQRRSLLLSSRSLLGSMRQRVCLGCAGLDCDSSVFLLLERIPFLGEISAFSYLRKRRGKKKRCVT